MVSELPGFQLVTIMQPPAAIMRADSLFCGIRHGNADSPSSFIDSPWLQPL